MTGHDEGIAEREKASRDATAPGAGRRELPLIVPTAELNIVDSGPALRDGGQTDGLRLCVAPDLETYLFKRYNSATAEHVRVPPLLDMIRWRRELPDHERAELDARCAWPIAAVGTPDRVEGILIRLADPAMFERRVAPTGTVTDTPRHLDELARGPERARRIAERYGIKKAYYEPPYKLAVLGELLDIVTWLHRHGYAVGDLQLRNAVFTIEPRPRVFLLDCDSCVPLEGEGAMPPVDPEQWKLPAEQQGRPFDATSDHYKFAWAVVRCVQETIETWHPDREVLCRVMRSDTVDMLIECARTLPPPGVGERLREAAALWPRMVIGDRMYVSVDDYLKKPWPAGESAVAAASGEPAVAAASEPSPPAPTRPAEVAARPSGNNKWLVAAIVLACVLVLLLLRAVGGGG
ncbi:hypothetical protein AB0K60_09090 [Thermopolyspora sp. NPDC052614]|uniref:hypothetical protein n=1 Tax=Thermopolyspora sp. NPDC052614 TaxID=3155682 RepID=UPI0034287042